MLNFIRIIIWLAKNVLCEVTVTLTSCHQILTSFIFESKCKLVPNMKTFTQGLLEIGHFPFMYVNMHQKSSQLRNIYYFRSVIIVTVLKKVHTFFPFICHFETKFDLVSIISGFLMHLGPGHTILKKTDYGRSGNQSVSLHIDSKWHSICILTKLASVRSNNANAVSSRWLTVNNWCRAAKQVISLALSVPLTLPSIRINLQLSVITCQKGSITKSYICICTVQKEDYYPKWIINIMKTLTTKKE